MVVEEVLGAAVERAGGEAQADRANRTNAGRHPGPPSIRAMLGRSAGYGISMDDDRRNEELEDGRPAEVREGEQPQADADKDEDIPDPSTVESVGY